MRLTPPQLEQFDREGYLFFPAQFTPRGNARPHGRRARALQPARGLQRARKRQGGGAHQLRRAHVQRALRAAGAASAHGAAGDGPVRRSGVHAPVQDQRQGGIRRRRLAVAPGLRHLAQRRHDAHRARDERRDLPGRRERVQRPADVHSRQPQEGRGRGEARPHHHQLSAVDRGQRADRRAGGAGRRRKTGASSAPRARPAR